MENDVIVCSDIIEHCDSDEERERELLMLKEESDKLTEWPIA